MQPFLKKTAIFIIPFILLLCYYIIVDPFYVIYKYKTNNVTYDNGKYCPNDALRGIQLMDLYDDSLHYNSFIIGSSRSDFYYVDEWRKYIGDDAVCFHFNQSGDNLQGTLERVRYLYKRFNRVDNLLLIMDREYLEEMTHHKGFLFRNPWQVTDERDFFAFHFEFFRAFFTIDYQKQMLGIESDEEKTKTLPSHYDPRWNENHKDGAEYMLNTGQTELYYSRFDRYYALYQRDSIEQIAKPVIKEEQIAALKEIVSLMENSNTSYRVVISPLYNQEKLNPKDLTVLENVFGHENVFDFSGINKFTCDKSNYYEVSHYRPVLCNRILHVIYQK